MVPLKERTITGNNDSIEDSKQTCSLAELIVFVQSNVSKGIRKVIDKDSLLFETGQSGTGLIGFLNKAEAGNELSPIMYRTVPLHDLSGGTVGCS